METEKLIQGNQLQEQIKQAKKTLKIWQETTAFSNRCIQINTPSNRSYEWAAVSPETFTIVKALNVAFYTEVVAQLEIEFNEL